MRRSIRATSTDSKGGITRSESIDLSVAAVVTGVLPNGNLIISGSQEVRVNFEIARAHRRRHRAPARHLDREHRAYDKIAEARISYGGRGRIKKFSSRPGASSSSICVTPF